MIIRFNSTVSDMYGEKRDRRTLWIPDPARRCIYVFRLQAIRAATAISNIREVMSDKVLDSKSSKAIYFGKICFACGTVKVFALPAVRLGRKWLRSERKTGNNIFTVIFYITRVLENKLISLNTHLERITVNYSLFLFLTY